MRDTTHAVKTCTDPLIAWCPPLFPGQAFCNSSRRSPLCFSTSACRLFPRASIVTIATKIADAPHGGEVARGGLQILQLFSDAYGPQRVDFATARNCLAAICARGHVRHLYWRGPLVPQSRTDASGQRELCPGTQKEQQSC